MSACKGYQESTFSGTSGRRRPIPHDGKLGKRRVEEHRARDGTEDESSTCKGLEFQESMQKWGKTGCECWDHVIRWGACQGSDMKIGGIMLRSLAVGIHRKDYIGGSKRRLVLDDKSSRGVENISEWGKTPSRKAVRETEMS